MTQFLGMLAAIALTAFCWGVYGPVLHFGREAMHSNLRPFMCVGLAYFVIAVIVPLALLARGGERGGWTSKGVLWSMLAGTAGALGALGVILALGFGDCLRDVLGVGLQLRLSDILGDVDVYANAHGLANAHVRDALVDVDAFAHVHKHTHGLAHVDAVAHLVAHCYWFPLLDVL